MVNATFFGFAPGAGIEDVTPQVRCLSNEPRSNDESPTMSRSDFCNSVNFYANGAPQILKQSSIFIPLMMSIWAKKNPSQIKDHPNRSTFNLDFRNEDRLKVL